MNHYIYLKEHPDIEIVDRQKTFLLLEGFRWFDIESGKWRRARNMVYTPDFIIRHKDYDKLIAFESKGFARKDYKIRSKLFRYNYGDEYYFVEVHSLKQCKSLFPIGGEK